MKMLKYVLGIVAVLAIIALTTVFFDPFSSCPLKYRFELETKCWLRDENNNVKLIELFQAHSNRSWLAKIYGNDGKTVWLEHPYGIIDSYNDHVPDNDIRFFDKNVKWITVNGKMYLPKEYLKRP